MSTRRLSTKQLIDANLSRLRAVKPEPNLDLAVETPPYGVAGFPKEAPIASQSLGNVPERSKEEEETPMRQSDAANTRRRRKGDRLRPMVNQKNLDLRSPVNQQREEPEERAPGNRDGDQARRSSDTAGEIFSQIRRGTNDPKAKKRVEFKPERPQPSQKTSDLLGQLNKKIAERKRVLSTNSIKYNKNDDLIVLDMYKKSPEHFVSPFRRGNPSLVPPGPPLLGGQSQQYFQTIPAPQDFVDPQQNLYYPRHQQYSHPDLYLGVGDPRLQPTPQPRRPQKAANRSPLDAYMGGPGLSRQDTESDIKQKIQEEVEKQYKKLLQEQAQGRMQRNPSRGKSDLGDKKTALSTKGSTKEQKQRTQSQQQLKKRIEPHDDKTYVKYKRSAFDDTQQMLLANRISVQVKAEKKKEKEGGKMDVEKVTLKREIQELKQQMKAQQELFEVKQSLHELKEEMRRKREEYRRSEVEPSSSKNSPERLSKTKGNTPAGSRKRKASQEPKAQHVDAPVHVVDIQPRRPGDAKASPLLGVEQRPKSSDRQRWQHQRDQKKPIQTNFKSPFQDFVKGVGNSRLSKADSNNTGSKFLGNGLGAGWNFSRPDAQAEWKDTCQILDKCDIIHNQSGQVYKQKQTFTRSDITQIAHGFSKRIVKLEQDVFNKDWQLEKEKQNCKQLLVERRADFEKQLQDLRSQADFERKAMQQEVHKAKEKLTHFAKKRMQEREKLFEDVAQIKMHMEKQNDQLLQANEVLQKNFDLNVVGLDFSNDLQLITDAYAEEINNENFKKLQPFDGHGMRQAAPRGVKDVLKDIDNLRKAYAGRSTLRGSSGSPYRDRKQESKPRWSEEALENQMQLISDYITNQLDSGKDSNVFRQHERIKTEIVEPILKNAKNRARKSELLMSGLSPRSLTMSLTIDDQVYGGIQNTSSKKKRTNLYNHQSLSNILQMQNTQSLNMSLTASEKEVDPNQALSSITKPASLKLSHGKRQSDTVPKAQEYGGRASHKSSNARLDLPQQERSRSKKMRNSRSLSYNKSKSNHSTLSNHSASKQSRGIYIQKVDEDTHRPGRSEKRPGEFTPQRGYIDLTPEKVGGNLDERIDQQSQVHSLRSQLKLKASQLEKLHQNNTNMQKRIHQLQNETKALQDGNSHRMRTDERVADLEKKYYATILAAEKQKKTISDLQLKIQRHAVQTQQQQSAVSQLEIKNRVLFQTLSQRDWMQSLQESVKMVEEGRTNQLSAERRDQLHVVFGQKLVNDMEHERKQKENTQKLVGWLLSEQIVHLYRVQDGLRQALASSSSRRGGASARSSSKLRSPTRVQTLETAQGRKDSPSRKAKSPPKLDLDDAEQAYLDHMSRLTGSLKHKMLAKYQEYEEFKDFWPEGESDALYKILTEEPLNPGVTGQASDRYPHAFPGPQQITPRQQVSPGSGFEKPPFFANHRLQAQLLYSPRNSSKLRPQAPKGHQRASRSPGHRFDLRQLVQKEKKPEQKGKPSEKVWLELTDEEVTGVFYSDRELVEYLNTRGFASRPLNTDIEDLPGRSRVRFSDQQIHIDDQGEPKATRFQLYEDESSDEAAIAQEKSDLTFANGLAAGKNESLRKKRIQSSPHRKAPTPSDHEAALLQIGSGNKLS